MERTLQSLIDEATESVQWRGHDPHFWTHDGLGRPATMAYTTCKRRGCMAHVTVRIHPAPNQIDIGGDMLAVGCPNPPG